MKSHIRWLLLFFILLPAFLNPGHSSAAQAVVRSLVDNGACSPIINLVVSLEASDLVHAVEEFLPTGLTPAQISHDGIWDPVTKTIRWGPFADNQEQTLSYQASGPNLAYQLSGVAGFDGLRLMTTGASQLTVNCVVTPEQVAPPQFSVLSGAAIPVTVALSSDTPDSEIRYTLNGTLPDGDSFLYSSPLFFEAPTVIRAMSFKEGFVPSESVTVFYIDDPLDNAPVRLIDNQECPTKVELTIAPKAQVKTYSMEEVLPKGLTPRFISHNGVWDPMTRTIRWGPFSDNSTRTFIYRLVGAPSEYLVQGSASLNGRSITTRGDILAEINCTFSQVAAPEFSPPNRTNTPVEVTIISPTADVEIRYTTGHDISEETSTLYTEPLLFDEEVTIRAKAFAPGMLPSETVTAFYPYIYIPVETERTVSNSAECSSRVAIKLTPLEPFLVFLVEEYIPIGMYPTEISENGVWDPTTRKIRWGPFTANGPKNFSYKLTGGKGTHSLGGTASFDGLNMNITGDGSAVISCGAPLEQVAPAVILSTNSGVLPTEVSLSCDTDDAEIRYTINGLPPDENATLYSAPLNLLNPTFLRVRAFKQGMRSSQVTQADFPSSPLQSPFEITHSVEVGDPCTARIGLSVLPPETVSSFAVEHYLPPTLKPMNITGNGKWNSASRVIRWGGFTDNVPKNLGYQVKVKTGTYPLHGLISYNGKTENIDNFSVSVNCGLDFAHQQVVTPFFTPSSGTKIPADVSISCSTPGVVIRYTKDGDDPNEASAIYDGPIHITEATTLRAKAFKQDMLPSRIATASFYREYDTKTTTARSVEDNQSCSPFVNLRVDPGAESSLYAVEENMPPGLWPLDINQQGLWDETTRSIKWGPFADNNIRTLSFRMQSNRAGLSGNIAGTISIDGENEIINGPGNFQISCGVPSGLTVIPGNGVLYLSWSKTSSAVGYRVYYSTTFGPYEDFVDAGSENNYFALDGLENDTTYYLSLRAYDANGYLSNYSNWTSGTPFATGGRLGTISLDRNFYTDLTNTARIVLKDPDLNTDPNSLQFVDLPVVSDSDSFGLTMTLAEDGPNAGIFSSTSAGKDLGFIATASDAINSLIQVADGDSISITYTDAAPVITRTASAIFDISPPETVLAANKALKSLDGKDYCSPSYAFSLSAADTGSGVDRIEYRVDGVPFTVYEASFMLLDDGLHTINFFGVDRADHQELVKERIIIVDSVAPAPVTGLSGSQSDFSLILSWSLATEPDLAGYNLYRDGVRINASLLTAPGFTDLVISGKKYVYHATAVDILGFESLFSESFAITMTSIASQIIEPLPDTVFVDPEITIKGKTEPMAIITVMVNGVSNGQVTANSSGNFIKKGIGLREGINEISVVSVNGYGVQSPMSETTIVHLNQRPAALDSVSVVSGDTALTLSWSIHPEQDIAGYNVYRDGQKLNKTLVTITQYEDLRLTNNRQYKYMITAVDNNGSEGSGKEIVTSPQEGPGW